MHLELNKATQPKFKEIKTSKVETYSLEKQSKAWWILRKEQENSSLTSIFQGQLLSRVSCNKSGCLYYKATFDNFMNLSLPLD